MNIMNLFSASVELESDNVVCLKNLVGFGWNWYTCPLGEYLGMGILFFENYSFLGPGVPFLSLNVQSKWYVMPGVAENWKCG